jgi:hypothetical protein
MLAHPWGRPPVKIDMTGNYFFYFLCLIAFIKNTIPKAKSTSTRIPTPAVLPSLASGKIKSTKTICIIDKTKLVVSTILEL